MRAQLPTARKDFKVVNVPMADGSRKRFRVYPDGAVYEIKRVGQRRVRQEPFRTELFDMTWAPEGLACVSSSAVVAKWPRWPFWALLVALALLTIAGLSQ